MDKFIVVDVETANANLSSICQIGIAVFENGELIETWETLVNPEDYFDGFNVSIHGIDEQAVKDAPTISQLKDKIDSYFKGNLVCSYSFFDKNAFSHHLDLHDIRWLDITRVVRRVWDEFSKSGYGLSNICKKKKIKLTQHHNALSDAISAGLVLLEALSSTSLSIDEIEKIATAKPIKRISLEGAETGKWFGEVLVFTGELSVSRKQAAQIASEAGFEISAGVTKKTTFIVKGYQDSTKLNGKEISSKEQKALDLISKGHSITLLSESDFLSLVS
ncbi:MAG: hypothetical protein KBT03_04515 [Bacteroidales bacterium]|nr:hypothetical protein [Candidatus Scybalousia scybalohippi]